MKKGIWIWIAMVIWTAAIAGNPDKVRKHSCTSGTPAKGGPEVLTTIDVSDTVVFDISKATTIGNITRFPVYFISDDSIFSLDFSFKYNQLDFTYDSIIDLTTYMQSLAYYNPVDSTVRYTSFSLQQIPNFLHLVSVRFSVQNKPLCSPDLNTVIAYLNGDVCSVKIVECVTTGIPSPVPGEPQVIVFSNHSSGILSVQSGENSQMKLLTLNGGQTVLEGRIHENEKNEFNIGRLAGGIYMMQVYNDRFRTVKRIFISNH